MTGRGWANEGVLRYVWKLSYGEPATPQIIIVDRSVAVSPLEKSPYGIQDEEFLVRKVGSIAIRRWMQMGAPLPKLSPDPITTTSL